jgi:hypothetical protein
MLVDVWVLRLVVVVATDVNPFVTHSERLLCAVVFY